LNRSVDEMIVGVIPEGPIAFDGSSYRYSKGERLYLDNLAGHFRELRLFTFVFRKGDPCYETCTHSPFSADNISINELPRCRSGKVSVVAKAWHFLKVFMLLVRLVPKVDLLYLFLPGYPSALGCLVGRLCGKIHIVYGADDWEQASASMFKWEHLRGTKFYRLYASLNSWMERTIVHSALFGVAAGGLVRQKYNRFGCPTYDTSPRMTLASSDIYEREDTCIGNEIVLINVGALIHDKAQHLLIEAFSALIECFPSLRLQLVGQGNQEGRLRKLALDLGVDSRVEFLGYVEDEKTLYRHLRSSDIFVLSSVTEGFPRVLYEAMAMRLPIVTTDVGGIPFLMKDGVNARVVKSGDVSGLEEALRDIILMPDARRSMIHEASITLESVFRRMNSRQIADLVETHLHHRSVSRHRGI